MSLADDFGQWKQSQPQQQPEQTPQPEIGWGERIKNDIVNTVGNYFTGAQQGVNEMARAQDAQMGDPLGQMYSGEGYQPPSDDTNQWVQDAQKNFMRETALPTLAVVPGMTIPAVANMLGDAAIDTYQNTEGNVLDKAGNAIRSVTYGPAVDMATDPELGQRFHDRPVSTIAEGAMVAGQALLPFVGAKRGVQKAGEIKNDLISHVENKLNEITDSPPLENIGIRGLDALDQLDAPNQGFRAATKPELQQTLLEQLDQLKGQKFDEANQQSYFDYMRNQEAESNGLQAQKNDIAGSVLMSPLDRMEVGADLPAKTSLGGQGRLLSETIEPKQLIVPKQEPILPQRKVENQLTIPTAMDLVNETQKRLFNNKLQEAVNSRDYYNAEQLASRMKQEGIETPLSRSVESQSKGNRLYSGLDPTGGRFDNVDIAGKVRAAAGKIKDNFSTQDNPESFKLSKFDKIYTALLDDKHPMSKIDKNLYNQSRIANARGYGRAQELLYRKGNESLSDIMEPIKDVDGFAKYLEAVHSADQYMMDMKTAMKPEEIQRIMDNAPPEWQKAQQQVVKYNNKLLNELVDSGILTKESVQAMQKKWQNYVPFMRDFSTTDAMETFVKTKGFINTSNPIKKLKGSEREIYNPLESIIKNTYTFTNMAERNKVGKIFAEMADKPNADRFIIKTDHGTADSKMSRFTVWKNGKKESYQTTPELYRAMASLDEQGSNFIVNLVSVPASMLRAGATLVPDFMARNLTRDANGAAINAKYGFVPILDSAKGLSHSIKQDALYWQWVREGGSMSSMMSMDRNYLGESVDKFKIKTKVDKAKTAINPSTYLNLLRTFSEKSEEATRLGVYEKALKAGADPIEAIIQSRESSIDFGRSGYYVKPLNRMTAFLNASVQGTDKLARTLINKDTRSRAMGAIATTIVVPSIVTWWMGKDDERVQRLPSWQKDLFWIIPTNGSAPGWDGLIRIPKPFEPGIIFGSGTERFLDYAYRKKPESFKGYGGSLFSAFMPSLIPTALIPIMEWWGNTSMFTGQDIVPRREEKLPPRLQYGVNNTETAKTIGNILNVSPRNIDSAVRGYTGGLGSYVTQGADYLLEKAGAVSRNAPAKPFTDTPLIKGFTTTSYRNSQPVQEFYDAIKNSDEIHAEAKLTKKNISRIDQQEKTTLDNAKKVMSALLKQEREVESSNKLNPDQKRDKLDKLQLQQTKLAEAVMKQIKKKRGAK